MDIDIFKHYLNQLEIKATDYFNADIELDVFASDEEFQAQQKVVAEKWDSVYKILQILENEYVGGMDALQKRVIEMKEKHLKKHYEMKKLEKEGFTGKKYKQCSRCKGTGMTGYSHVKGGICFKCNGMGKLFTSAYEKHCGIKKDDLPF